MTTESLLTLLQFSDGLFPVGSYAHSFGLESYVQDGRVRDADGVERFVATHLECSTAPADAAGALIAWRSSQAGDFPACLRLDAMLDSMKCASELRDASRQMGRQTLRVASKFANQSLVTRLLREVEAESSPGHHAIAFGIVGNQMGWHEREVFCAFLYSTASALVHAAIRLFPLGQLAGQQILFRLLPLIARLAEEPMATDESGIWSFNPSQEIAAMQHANLEARLFRS
ncbi:MAG: urease accessory protein UreF [Candidatus Korobacteraceae bacterium]